MACSETNRQENPETLKVTLFLIYIGPHVTPRVRRDLEAVQVIFLLPLRNTSLGSQHDIQKALRVRRRV
jgi:hypothetical protein